MKRHRILVTILIMIVLLFGTDQIQAATQRPATPSSVKTWQINYNSIKISWNQVTGASGYQVSRATSKTGPFKGVVFTRGKTFTNKGLVLGKTYYYKVRAYKYSGNKKVYGKFSPVYNTKLVLGTPSGAKVIAADHKSAKITWNTVNGASGYQISRATSESGPFKGIVFTSSNSYINRKLNSDKTYYYKVRAYRTVSGTKVYGKFTKIMPVYIEPLDAKVVGYYAAWSAYSGFTPDQIQVDKLTHINYAFANIDSNLKITLGYPDIDVSNIKKLNALKEVNPDLKTIISVGGWTWSSRFSDVALTAQSRADFATSCVDFIVKYGFDGVDLDWEYPVSGGMSTNINRPEDKTNFTLLLKTVREKLDAREKIDGKEYILTFAGATSTSYLNKIEASKLPEYVDYVNIMSYDIHGIWDQYTDFNAPLYTNNDVTLQYKGSVDQSVNAWLTAGFPPKQIVIGIPFYGVIYKAVGSSNNGLYQTYSGGSSISYKNIVANYSNNTEYRRYFHSVSKVPWLYNGTNFISYEDSESISLKADYIKNKGIGGAMIWELSQDHKGTLLNALYNGLK